MYAHHNGFTGSEIASPSFKAGFKITRMRLEVRGEVPGIDQAAFKKAAEAAKDGCPVSGALKGNVEIEFDARLM